MKTASFENTVDILVKAYLNDTLQHGACTKCAVGNLVSHALGGALQRVECSLHRGWPRVFVTMDGQQFVTPGEYHGEAQSQIDATGYAWSDLAKIEAAFEAHKPNMVTRDQAMFNGLMAVVEVLAEIHSVDLSVKESAKQLFVKA